MIDLFLNSHFLRGKFKPSKLGKKLSLSKDGSVFFAKLTGILSMFGNRKCPFRQIVPRSNQHLENKTLN